MLIYPLCMCFVFYLPSCNKDNPRREFSRTAIFIIVGQIRTGHKFTIQSEELSQPKNCFQLLGTMKVERLNYGLNLRRVTVTACNPVSSRTICKLHNL